MIFFLFLLFLILVGIFSLTLFHASLFQLGKLQTKTLFNSPLPFFRLLRRWFGGKEWPSLYFLVSGTKLLLSLCALLAILFFFTFSLKESTLLYAHLKIVALLLVLVILIDSLLRLFALRFPHRTLFFCFPIASIYLLLFFPLLAPLLKLFKGFFLKIPIEEKKKKISFSKEQIRELIGESDLGSLFDATEQKMLSSFLSFKEKVAREIMVPRIHVFSLPVETSIRQASSFLLSEHYSRIPIFRENLDAIVGVLMYKDLLKIYAKNEEKLLDTSIETLLKPVIYAPENKKISSLFQELRSKQIHLAIIVNEYGGTEGILTIEDILEELVGEIADEYDIGEAAQFWKLPNGSWVVDAKMSIVDIENHLDISIPSSPEYETIGGYVFHRAGTIPSKGWKIHHEDFELEVLISNERCIEKIRITPHAKE